MGWFAFSNNSLYSQHSQNRYFRRVCMSFLANLILVLIKSIRLDLLLFLFSDNIDERLILTIFGIFYTNDFSTRVANTNGDRSFSKVRLCYPLAAMCSHSCLANTSRHIYGLDQNFQVVITATTDIRKGDKILFNYLDITIPTIIRRKHLREVCILIFDSIIIQL